MPSMAATTVAVTLSDFDLAPESVEVVGPAIEFDVMNTGVTPHNLSVRDEAGALVGATETLGQGRSSELAVGMLEAGTYTIFCSLPGHESLGMSGTVVVSEDLTETETAAPA
jgi:plastocyanin